VHKTASSADLTWLLDELVDSLPDAQHGIILSMDGLLLAASRDLSTIDAEHLSAVAAGIQSLAMGASNRFHGGKVRQTIVEMRRAYLLVTIAGQGAALALLVGDGADVGLVAYEMALMVARVGHILTAPARSPELPRRPPPPHRGRRHPR
jgi:predicted regulator of Ras-like GTPase activity (Roadblock/LC7/MglB family)